VIVFIATNCGVPPEQITTIGQQLGEGQLHFGYKDKGCTTKSGNVVDRIFFVIHPNNWGPHQRRFVGSADEWATDKENLASLAGTLTGAAAAGTGAGAAVSGVRKYP
jgi:hypothetical protein